MLHFGKKNSGMLFICQRHFRIKRFPFSSSIVKPRESAGSILEKSLHDAPTPTIFYKSFLEFLNQLKLTGCEVSTTDITAHFTFNDEIHSVPKYEIRVDENLSFIIRILLWTIPSNHETK